VSKPQKERSTSIRAVISYRLMQHPSLTFSRLRRSSLWKVG
jgi:hypothetical protein